MQSFEKRFQAFELLFKFFDVQQVITVKAKCSFVKCFLKFMLLLFLIAYEVRIILSLALVNNDDFLTRYYLGEIFSITDVDRKSVARIAIAVHFIIFGLQFSINIALNICERRKSRQLTWIHLIDAKLRKQPELLAMTNRITIFEKYYRAFNYFIFLNAAGLALCEVLFEVTNVNYLEAKIKKELDAQLDPAITFFWLVSNAIFCFLIVYMSLEVSF